MTAVTNPPDSAARVDPKTAEKAVNALLKWKASESEKQKPQLLEQDEFVYLILTLKKIPQPRTNADKIPLPHALLRPETDNSELCLIIDDRSKARVTKDEAQKKIKAENIPVAKVLTLTKLKANYKPFEAKRKLCDSYDMFFADKAVIPLLPKLLGKHFFKKRKIPVPLDVTHKNWKQQIEKACGSGLLYLRTGTCSVVKVARVSMTKEDIVENVVAAIEQIGEIVPRKWGNIRSLHLKLLESIALPIYQVVPDLVLRIESEKDVAERKEKEKEGKAKSAEKTENKKKEKGRIREVKYLDSNIGEIFDEDELDLGGNSEEEIDGGDEDDIVGDKIGSGEVGGKKRKKSDATESLKDAKKEKKKGGVKQKKLKKESLIVNAEDGLTEEEKKTKDGVKQKKLKKECLIVNAEDGLGEEEKKKDGAKQKKLKKVSLLATAEDGLGENVEEKKKDGVKQKKLKKESLLANDEDWLGENMEEKKKKKSATGKSKRIR